MRRRLVLFAAVGFHGLDIDQRVDRAPSGGGVERVGAGADGRGAGGDLDGPERVEGEGRRDERGEPGAELLGQQEADCGELDGRGDECPLAGGWLLFLRKRRRKSE